MRKDLRDKQLKSLASSDLGDALKDYINEKIDELNNSSTITGTPEKKIIELEARQLAIKKLSEIFNKLKKSEPPKKRGIEFE